MANNKKNIKKEISRRYIAKDFNSMRLDLQRFAQTYYPDNMQDFSEASLGGLLMDLAAYVGDSMSFYTDHQFRELDPTSAVEAENIERMAQNVGIQIPGAAPSVAAVRFYLRIPAVEEGGILVPDKNVLPVIQKNTVLKSSIGVKFFLIEDLDFSKKNSLGHYIADKQKINKRGGTDYFIMSMEGTCVSGEMVTERFTIANTYVPFRTITLSNSDVSTILEITDTEGNEYYEVESLTQDTVFKSFPNSNEIFDDVQSNLAVIPAPYRFTSNSDIKTRQTRIQFGSGRSSNLADDGVPDPSNLSLPLYGKKTMSRFSLDPSALLDTKTLGISPQNTTISVNYRFGGGSSHNVSPGSINMVEGILIKFKDGVSGTQAIDIRSSLEIRNQQPASGGADRPTTEDVRRLIPTARNLQSRIVTREDLISRIYLLPNEYGRIYRASITANPSNPLASILYVVSRDRAGKLSRAPDILKKNISKYLNEFRMISDAIDILDVRIINYRVAISIIAAPNANKTLVAKTVLDKIKALLRIEKFQVGQPIIESDIINAIINTPGVLSLIELNLVNLNGTVSAREYSNIIRNLDNFKHNGIYFVGPGDIFELRYPNEDISIMVK